MHKKVLAVGGVLGVLVLGGVVLGNGLAFATQSCSTDSTTGVITCANSATASVTVSAACTLKRTTGDGNYSATLANNATTSDIPGSTFTAYCNDSGGFALYAVGFSNDELGNTDLIASVGSDYNIKTNGTGTNSNWKMKLSAVSGTYAPTISDGTVTGEEDFTTYHVIPNTYTKVAYRTSSTLDPSSGSTEASGNGSGMTVYYQAFASSTQPAGTYTGQVKYTMVHPNNVDMPTINDITYMQDLANLNSTDFTKVLNSMTTGTSYTLTDIRDNTDYSIAKLGDGNVWMVSNLAIASGTELTSAQSNVSNSYTIPTTTWTGGDSYVEGLVYDNDGSVWYNYCAASAGTVCDGTVATVSTYDICPLGWRLPTSTEQAGIISYAATAGLVSGGYYAGGSLVNTSNGYWWSTTGDSAANRDVLVYDGNSLASTSLDKSSGAFVRCMLNPRSGS